MGRGIRDPLKEVGPLQLTEGVSRGAAVCLVSKLGVLRPAATDLGSIQVLKSNQMVLGKSSPVPGAE